MGMHTPQSDVSGLPDLTYLMDRSRQSAPTAPPAPSGPVDPTGQRRVRVYPTWRARRLNDSGALPTPRLPILPTHDLLPVSVAEGHRLLYVEHLALTAQHGALTRVPLPSPTDMEQQAIFGVPFTVLDLGCGLGSWAQRIQDAYGSRIYLIGIDAVHPDTWGVPTLPRTFAFLHGDVLAHGLHQLRNVHDQLVDVNDRSVDLVRLAQMAIAIPTEAWTGLLREAWRVIKPGGYLELCDMTLPRSAAPGLQQINRLVTLAYAAAGIHHNGSFTHGALLEAAGLPSSYDEREILLPYGARSGRLDEAWVEWFSRGKRTLHAAGVQQAQTLGREVQAAYERFILQLLPRLIAVDDLTTSGVQESPAQAFSLSNVQWLFLSDEERAVRQHAWEMERAAQDYARAEERAGRERRIYDQLQQFHQEAEALATHGQRSIQGCISTVIRKA